MKEANPKEEVVTPVQEASLALVPLGEEPQLDDIDRDIEGDDVMDEIPELEVQTLYPILIEGVEFLFLDDIAHVLGMHQDETLSVLAMYAGIRDTQHPSNNDDIRIEFNSTDVTKALTLPENHDSIESLVAESLVQISQSKDFYEGVPETSFAPHKPLAISDRVDLGSINISDADVAEQDDATEVISRTFFLYLSIFYSRLIHLCLICRLQGKWTRLQAKMVE